MTNLENLTQEQREEAFLFLTINRWSNSYANKLNQDFSYSNQKELNLEEQSESVILQALEDISLIKEREKAFKARKGFKVGEVIKLPYGLSTHITHVWEDGQIQTGNLGSCHLSTSGYLSRSGGLDSGLKASELIPTEKTEKHSIWIFHKGSSGADRGVYYPIEFNVYEVKEGADLSGTIIPQHEKKILQEKSETITRINGNGNPYTLHMPMIYLDRNIFKDIKNWHELENGIKRDLHGLEFIYQGWNFKTQPMTKNEIDTFLRSGKYHAKFYNNGTYRNTLFIESSNNLDKKRTLIFS